MKRMNVSEKVRCISVLAALLLSLLFLNGTPAQAQDRGNPNWYVRVTPYLWLSNIGGAKTLGEEPGANTMNGFMTHVDDTMLATNWAGRLEAGKGRWRALINFSRASDGNPTGITRLSDSSHFEGRYDLTWTTAEVFLVAQVGPFSQNHAFELYFGGRFIKQNQKLSSDSDQILTEIDEFWAEPSLGFRYYTELGRRFWAQFHTDIGGFLARSNFTWTLGGELGFRVIRFADLTLRYDYQEMEFDNEKDGADRYVWHNGVQQGWYFGLMFKL